MPCGPLDCPSSSSVVHPSTHSVAYVCMYKMLIYMYTQVPLLSTIHPITQLVVASMLLKPNPLYLPLAPPIQCYCSPTPLVVLDLPLTTPFTDTLFLLAPPLCNLSPHLACGQATPSALIPPSVSLVPPSVSLVDVTHQCTSDQSMTSPRREWATTGLSRDKYPSISLSQYGFVNVPSSPNARVVPTTTNQRLLLDTPSTSNQIVMADAPTTTHPRVLGVSSTQNRVCVNLPFQYNNQKNLTDTLFINPQGYDADCKRYDGVEGLPPRAMQGVPSLSLSSPLLFDSAPSICSSPIPMSQKAPHPAPSVCQRYPQPVASTVKFSTETLDSSDDSDVTPPISPHGSPEVMHHLLVVDHTKTSTSSHLKRNVRVARTKSCAESGVNVECEQQPKFPLLYAHVRCLCRGSLCQDKGKLSSTTSDIVTLISLPQYVHSAFLLAGTAHGC